MSGINAFGAMVFSNPVAQNGAGSNPNAQTNSLSATVPAQLSGQAFAMTLSQQVGADGADNDSVIFESSGQTGNGGYATVSMSTGNSFSSAFANMLASFQDAKQAITEGTDTTMADLGQSADEMGGVLGQLAADLQNSNSDGTAGVGEEMLPLSTSTPGVPSGNATADGMLSFFNAVIASLDFSLQSSAPDSGGNPDNSNNPNNTVA